MDPITIATGKLLAPVFIKSFLDSNRKNTIFKNVSDELKQAFSDGISSYLSKYELAYSSIKTILHRHEPVPFYDIYFPVKLEREGKNYEEVEDLVETSSVSKIFWQTRFITVTGSAGSGKSTLAKHIFLNSMKEGIGIPILVELRNLIYSSQNFYEYIRETICGNELAKNEKILERLLIAGKFVFLIDGFDEVKRDAQNSILLQLNTFVSKYKHNRFMLTSRPGVNLELFPMFHNYKMKDLDGEEIYDFVRKQKLSEISANSIIEFLSNNKSRYLDSYLSNPLLLTLYLVTYTNNSAIPEKKSLFYRRVFDVLFREHDTATKIGYERDLLTKLSQERIEDVLKFFSFITFFDNHYTFDKEYLNRKLAETKEKLRQKYSSFPDFNIEHFIYDLRVAIGIWIEDESYTYFVHRSMQEYFAAISISGINVDKEKIYVKIISKIEQIHENYAKYGSENEVNPYIYTNFLSLCKEVDEFSYLKYVKIPLLRELVNSCRNLTDEDNALFFLKISGVELYFKNESEKSRVVLIRFVPNKYILVEEARAFSHHLEFFDYEYTIPEDIKKDVPFDKIKSVVDPIEEPDFTYSFCVSFIDITSLSWLPKKARIGAIEKCNDVRIQISNLLCDSERQIDNATQSDVQLTDLI